MLDPNFERSVILLSHYDANGSLGFVLNMRTNLHLSDIVPELPDCTIPIYLGGPVAQKELFFVHRRFDLLLSGEEVSSGIYFGGDPEKLVLLLRQKQLDTEDIKFFVGYSGWAKDQLEEEIQGNSWAVQNKWTTDMIFEGDGELLWKQAVIGLGAKYAHVANFPQTPDLN